VLTVVLGALLGAENLNAPEASGWLRVPALIAALILVAQGLLDFENGRRERHENARRIVVKERAADVLETHSAPSPTPGVRMDETILESGSPKATNVVVEKDATAQAQEQAARQVAGTTVRESGGAVLAILVLAVWLGLATLNYSTAPASLLGLSLIASFLLFASAWSMLQTRRA
jgi:hypothetical protein